MVERNKESVHDAVLIDVQGIKSVCSVCCVFDRVGVGVAVMQASGGGLRALRVASHISASCHHHHPGYTFPTQRTQKTGDADFPTIKNHVNGFVLLIYYFFLLVTDAVLS